eukprot:9480310-Pyramimonas_sp.AAC.1
MSQGCEDQVLSSRLSKEPGGFALLVLGFLMFVPGAYHTVIAYKAFMGRPGFTFSALPEVLSHNTAETQSEAEALTPIFSLQVANQASLPTVLRCNRHDAAVHHSAWLHLPLVLETTFELAHVLYLQGGKNLNVHEKSHLAAFAVGKQVFVSALPGAKASPAAPPYELMLGALPDRSSTDSPNVSCLAWGSGTSFGATLAVAEGGKISTVVVSIPTDRNLGHTPLWGRYPRATRRDSRLLGCCRCNAWEGAYSLQALLPIGKTRRPGGSR